MGVLPTEVEEILNAALVCEFSAVNARGIPVTHPMIPLYDGEKIFMTSSILFSKKLDHVRRNPKVSVSVTDRTPVHGDRPRGRFPVQGEPAPNEAVLHPAWGRVLRLWIAKEPIVQALYA